MKKSKGSRVKAKPSPYDLAPSTCRWYGCYDHPRDSLFTVESNRHPAKMAVGLCERIFCHGRERGWWKPGDVILDPMAGIGTTLLVGAVLGYRTVGVELESHFVKLCVENIAHARRWFAPTGDAALLQGDSRKLSDLLIGPSGDFQGAATSPPYGEMAVMEGDQAAHPGFKNCHLDERDDRGKVRESPGAIGYGDGAVASPLYSDQQVTASSDFFNAQTGRGKLARDGHHLDGYADGNSEGGSQKAELPVGALCSPVYGETVMPMGVRAEIHQIARVGRWDEAVAMLRRCEEKQVEKNQKFAVSSDETLRAIISRALEVEDAGYGTRSPESSASPASSAVNPSAQIGNLRDPKDDIDRVLQCSKVEGLNAAGAVTSPPWATASDHDMGKIKDTVKMGHSDALPWGETEGQIANLPDGAVTSPPWEKQARGGQQGWTDPAEAARIAAERYEDGSRAGHPATAQAIEAQMRRENERTYGDAPGQVGQMEKETYCAAMLTVYQQLWLVLRPGGVVALVTKNPVKKGAIRRLDLDTIRLMEAAGFQFLERQMAMLASPEVTQQGMGLAFATEDEQGQPVTVEVGKTVTVRRERKSFFKRLHEKRYPHLRVDHEDVLWFRKGGETKEVQR